MNLRRKSLRSDPSLNAIILAALFMAIPPVSAWNYILWPMVDCFGSPVAGFVNCKVGDCCRGKGAVDTWSARADYPPPGDTLRSMYISFWKSNTICADKQDNQIPIFLRDQDITDSASQKSLQECRVLTTSDKQSHFLESNTQALSETLNVVYSQMCLQPRIATGFYHTCAIRGQRLLPSGASDTNDVSAGTLACWGFNSKGQANPEPSLMTPPMKGGDRWIGISAGYQHTCGLRTGYYVTCFGDGGSELVTGDMRKNAPMPPDWERVSKGGFQWTSVSCGTTYTAGVMNETRKGFQIRFFDPPANTNRDWNETLLAKVPPGAPSNRTLLIWGSTYYEQATQLPVFSDWRIVRAGHYHVCGIREDGSMLCWGDNLRGQCDVPQSSLAPTKWKDVACGKSHTCGIKQDNTMQCWGSNDNGQCEVACEDFWVAVAAGEGHTCAIAADSTVRCWGSNTFGQTVVPVSPSNIPLAYWTEIQVGNEHTCGIREYVSAQNLVIRELLCWGGNTHGQIDVPAGNLTVQTCPIEFSITPQLVLERPHKYWNYGYRSDSAP
jgi:hypothetical protein